MKPIKSTKLKRISGILTIGLGGALCITAVWIILLIISLIKGTSFPLPDAFPVNILMTHSRTLVNSAKDIYIGDISGNLLFFKPPVILTIYSGLYTIVIWSCVSYVIFQMLKIINSMISGDPFEKLNGKRLRIIARFFIAAPVLIQLASYIIINSILHTVDIENIKVSAQLFNSTVFISMFAGVLLYVLSETLRAGTEIKEENELTV